MKPPNSPKQKQKKCRVGQTLGMHKSMFEQCTQTRVEISIRSANTDAPICTNSTKDATLHKYTHTHKAAYSRRSRMRKRHVTHTQILGGGGIVIILNQSDKLSKQNAGILMQYLFHVQFFCLFVFFFVCVLMKFLLSYPISYFMYSFFYSLAFLLLCFVSSFQFSLILIIIIDTIILLVTCLLLPGLSQI